MRVLVVHNRYRSDPPSGENDVVDSEISALRLAGVEVETYMQSSDEIGEMTTFQKAGIPLTTVSGWPTRQDLRQVLSRYRPDVVHFHNPYPLITPAVVWDCKALGIPTVATVHNFRLECMSGTFFRAGEICTECEGRSLRTPGVVHGCYRSSHLQSGVMATAMWRHRSAWHAVDRLIALSGFVAGRLRSWGFRSEQVVVKPNSVEDPGEPEAIGEGFLFAGRLSHEKGVLDLLEAWGLSGLGSVSTLTIAGSGPLAREVEAKASARSRVEFIGHRSKAELRGLRDKTAAAVVPSTWFEVNPLSVLESFAASRPVVAYRLGSLDGLVDDEVGWMSEPSPSALAQALRAASLTAGAGARGSAARERYLRLFHPDKVIQDLIHVYEAVMTR